MKVRYGGVNLDEQFECIVTKRPLPEFRASSSNVYGVDGEVFEGVNYGTREITIAVYTLDKKRRGIQRAARDLMSILATHEEKKLFIGDEIDKDGNELYRLAVPSGTFDFEQFIHAGKWEITFKQFDPYLYGKDRVERLRANQMLAINSGGGENVEAWPVITATPTSNTFTLQKLGGEHITFKGAIAGKKLTVNMRRQIVKVEPDITTGEGLQLGSRFFSIEGAVGITANCPAEIAWTERWL